MSLLLTVHRGTREIGGSCIEISHPGGSRLVLDAGRPLDAPEGATGLLPASLDRTTPATVLISHPHQDHYGLLSEIPDDWPVWTGAASARLIGITDEIASKPEGRAMRTWNSRSGPFDIGPFKVTPLLTDHSAFDAYMLLVESEGKRILYTGDFRRHGRKSALVDAMMARPPRDIDVLVTEGTNLGTDKPVRSETDLETDFTDLLAQTPGRLFVSWSGQNIDRTVTLYRAAKRTGRTLVIDLYTADVLDRIAAGTRLPCAGFPNLKVVITGSLSRNYKSRGREDFVARMARDGVAARDIPKTAILMLRRALVQRNRRVELMCDVHFGGGPKRSGDHVPIMTDNKSGNTSMPIKGILGTSLTAMLLLAASPSALYAANSNEELASEIKALRAQIKEMKAAISETRVETRRTQAKVRAVAGRSPAPVVPVVAGGYPVLPAGAVPAFVTADKKLQFGAITITPGGFLAGESVFRTRTLNSDVNSNFGAIPFPNSSLAHVNEFRPSGRQSRFALLMEGAITPTMIAAGYAEFDFLSATTTANSNQTNSYTPRVRNLYATLDANDYGLHILAGQSWSLVTLNSKGITPRNEVTPAVIDSAQTVGSIYARQPQIRITKDFGKKLWLSLSAEESETTFNPACGTPSANSPTGAVGSLTPAAVNGGLVGPSNVTSITCGAVGSGAFAPQTNYSLNHLPDVIGKAAYEATLADRDIHLEATGLYTNLYDRVGYTDTLGNNQFTNKNTAGWGAGAGIIVPVLPKRLDFQANALYGRGIGRYGPGGIAESSFNPDGSLKALPELIALAGLTLHATPAIDIYAYGGVETQARSYFEQNNGSFIGTGSPSINDTTCRVEASAAATCNGTTRTLWEVSAGFWDKIYKGSFGEVRAGVQYAYVKREIFDSPLSTTSTPKTDDHMIFTSIRYYPFQ